MLNLHRKIVEIMPVLSRFV